jgi:predicted alpha-1,2-mannosidase
MILLVAALCLAVRPSGAADRAAQVDPLVGTAGGGNTFPGAVVPFGMLAWSPETTRGDATRRPAPGGYHHDVTRIRGFSVTHLSGTGCRGASGDVPFMPHIGAVASSPSLDRADRLYASRYSHVNERAEPGLYVVRLASGVKVELTAGARTGRGRFSFPPDQSAAVLVRASDSEVGSSDARVEIDAAHRTITGEVTSGNFCGYLNAANRRSYYTLYFVAVFDRPFAATGVWQDGKLTPGGSAARGGTGYGEDGFPPAGKGSGAYLVFDPRRDPVVEVEVGISYASLDNARRNLAAERAASFEAARRAARARWNEALGAIEVDGGSPSRVRTFYTALYHALLHPNLFSDVNGEYRGFDQQVHRVAAPQRAQYANFSGWDVYRSQLQLVTWLDPRRGADIAQSLLNQANQNGGEWDRWTHNSGGTHVMTGDPSAPALADIQAFGGTGFDARGALASLARAATVPTAHDLSRAGCEEACVGQRPSLDRWLSLHYIPAVSNAWGGAGETLEASIADFALSQMALRLGDEESSRRFLERAQSWHQVWNPATGYIQDRNEDGSWPAFDPASDRGFAEGSSAQYTWMVPFDVHGLVEAMGGTARASARLDAFFHEGDGSWALTGTGDLHAELDNEPSLGAPWVYHYLGRPHRAQETVRQALDTLWGDRPDGIPGNDDLGAMSSWYVLAALGLYPAIPGRAELLVTSPLFPRVTVRRAGGRPLTVRTSGAGYVTSLRVDGRATTRAWLPEPFALQGTSLEVRLSPTPSRSWGTAPADWPPSFAPERP